MLVRAKTLKRISMVECRSGAGSLPRSPSRA
jgi:hypothetical protein